VINLDGRRTALLRKDSICGVVEAALVNLLKNYSTNQLIRSELNKVNSKIINGDRSNCGSIGLWEIVIPMGSRPSKNANPLIAGLFVAGGAPATINEAYGGVSLAGGFGFCRRRRQCRIQIAFRRVSAFLRRNAGGSAAAPPQSISTMIAPAQSISTMIYNLLNV
jgi:hypothetical protein